MNFTHPHFAEPRWLWLVSTDRGSVSRSSVDQPGAWVYPSIPEWSGRCGAQTRGPGRKTTVCRSVCHEPLKFRNCRIRSHILM